MHLNTGGHGGKDGSNPTNFSCGEGWIIEQDHERVKNSSGKVSYHVVSVFSGFIYPPNIDVINTNCYGCE